MPHPKEEEAGPVDECVAALYVEFFKLRRAGRYQEEYDEMGTLMSMLQTDRDHLRKKYGVRP